MESDEPAEFGEGHRKVTASPSTQAAPKGSLPKCIRRRAQRSREQQESSCVELLQPEDFSGRMNPFDQGIDFIECVVEGEARARCRRQI